ncbi:hypothetical protein Bbelb_278890 [Branchiostoma belcheri]|nr:hypothetical protein Bbelb_278890 [Branchiostoma belcheri]
MFMSGSRCSLSPVSVPCDGRLLVAWLPGDYREHPARWPAIGDRLSRCFCLQQEPVRKLPEFLEIKPSEEKHNFHLDPGDNRKVGSNFVRTVVSLADVVRPVWLKGTHYRHHWDNIGARKRKILSPVLRGE